MHAYGIYTHRWITYDRMGLDSFKLLIHMHMCNGLGWHEPKLCVKMKLGYVLKLSRFVIHSRCNL